MGGIRLADAVVAVSPTYAREILTEAEGMGVEDELQARGDSLVGILNGIDTAVLGSGRRLPPSRHVLLAGPGRQGRLPEGRCWSGWDCPTSARPVVRDLGRRGSCSRRGSISCCRSSACWIVCLRSWPSWATAITELASALEAASAAVPERVGFFRGYDEGLSHLLFGGGDLLAMPSRFEPCGLAQMQAMRYGTLPVVTDVGGLHDTVVDIDDHADEGTGVVASAPSTVAMLDALHRGVRAHGATTRRHAMQRRGMSADWSWTVPARQHIDLYDRLVGGSALIGGPA